MIAGAGTDGLVISADTGLTWRQTAAPVVGRVNSALVTRSGIILVGATGWWDPWTGGTVGGIFRSTDDGQTWIGSDLGDVSTGALVEIDNGACIAATANGIVRSTDTGSTWSVIDPEVRVGALVRTHGGTIFGAGNGIYISFDDGTSWIQRIAPAGNFWSIDADESGNVMVGGPADSSWLGMLRSTNSGESWEQVDSAGLSGGVVLAIGSHPASGILAFSRTGQYSSVLGIYHSQTGADGSRSVLASAYPWWSVS